MGCSYRIAWLTMVNLGVASPHGATWHPFAYSQHHLKTKRERIPHSFTFFLSLHSHALQLSLTFPSSSRPAPAGEDGGDRPNVTAPPSSSATLNPKPKFLNTNPTYVWLLNPNMGFFFPKPPSNGRIGAPLKMEIQIFVRFSTSSKRGNY